MIRMIPAPDLFTNESNLNDYRALTLTIHLEEICRRRLETEYGSVKDKPDP